MISALEKVDQEQNYWVENMLGGLLVKRAVKNDILRARELFKKAYGRGSSTAVQNLAELEFIVENYESSLFYLEKLRLLDLKRKSQEQYVNWVRLLGQHHQYGFGVEKNVNKAKQLYREIVNVDKSGATHYLMADAEYHVGNTSLSLELFKESANLGYINAITKLADAYFFGTRVKKDLDKSLEYYIHASSLGLVSAYYNQSVIYQKQKKYIEMKVALIKAAKLGHIKAKKITVENDIKIENYEFNDGVLKEKDNLFIKR